MLAYLGSAGSGFMFALGLGLAGMTDANKVVAFLDLSGDWDPSLGFVMAGAVITYAVLERLILRRARPMFAESFAEPGGRGVDRNLVVGAALFGCGWGLAGYCPAPALVSIVGLGSQALTFSVAMVLGMLAVGAWRARA